MAAGSEEIEHSDADERLDLFIERYPSLAQQFLHEFNSGKPAPTFEWPGEPNADSKTFPH